MQVAVKAGGIQGDRIEVSSVRGDFQAIWMGDVPVASGAVLDMEVEVPGSVVALWKTDPNEATSIESVGGHTSIVGEAAAITAEGVLVLDLHPGIVVVELANPHDAGVVRGPVRVVGGCVRVYPTGI
ncbi:hypothetical protein [Prescottella agglutinans]|uniref:hypothetical protein n=1 Tax=Prescottella agglutinans TaxID=1644129 RepID=UPI003D960863